jgi:hypothetical protein
MRSDLEDRGRILPFTIIGVYVCGRDKSHDTTGSVEYTY